MWKVVCVALLVGGCCAPVKQATSTAVTLWNDTESPATSIRTFALQGITLDPALNPDTATSAEERIQRLRDRERRVFLLDRFGDLLTEIDTFAR